MSRTGVLAYIAVAVWLFAGCKQDPTAVHVHVHLGDLSYDELRFGVLEVNAGDGTSPPMLLVDPEGAGRKAGLSGGRDQDVVVLLNDDVDGNAILCDVAALADGLPVGHGDGTVQARAHQVRDVDVYITAAPTGDASAPGDAAIDTSSPGDGGGGGTGGRTGSGGQSGAGGVSGTGGKSGTGGGTGSGGRTGSGGAVADAGGTDATAAGGASGEGGASGTGGAGMGGASGVGGVTGSGGKTGTGAIGSMCTSGDQCASTFCADGVCCDSACTGACTTCTFNPGQTGHCRPVMNKVVDPHHVCVNAGPNGCTDGTCTNAGACTQKAFGTACAAGCTSAQERSASGICSQAGSCLGVGAIPCPVAMPSCVAPNICR